MFESKRVRLVAIVVVWAVVLGGLTWARWYERSRSDAHVRRDRASVEAASRRLRWEEVSEAWTDLKLHRPSRMGEIQASIPVAWAATHEEGGAIILVFRSGDGSKHVCIDLLVRPGGNRVRTRDC